MSEVEGGDYELAKAVESGTQQVLIPAIKDMGETLEKVSTSVGTGADRVADTALEADATAEQGFHDAGQGLGGTPSEGGVTPNEGTPAPSTGGQTPKTNISGTPQDDFGGGKGGQTVDGASNCETGGVDPVDVVSGQMIIAKTDVALPGVLPLVLRRAYASGYGHGRMFGPGWSSTLDERVVVDADGIHFLGDDAQTLNYGIPTQPGQQVLPVAGARWPLTWDRHLDAIEILDPATGTTRHFAPPPRNDAMSPDQREVRHLTRITDRNSNWLTITRDEDGVPIEVDHVGGYRVAVDSTYRGSGFRIEGLRFIDPADPQGRGEALIGYRYDPAGRLVEILDSRGLPMAYECDQDDRVTAWIDRAGYRYEYQYDAAGRVVRTGGEDGLMASELSYDPEKRVTTVTDSLGHATEYHYDEHQHVCKTVDPLGAITLTESDRFGRLLAYTDELGHTTRYTLDAHGDQIRTERPDQTIVEIEYGELRKPVRLTGPDAATWQYTYDERGNLLASTDPAGATSTYVNTESGAVTRVEDALGAATVVATDRAGLPIAVTDPLGATWRITRDARGRIVAVTDPLEAVTRTVYDGEDHPLVRTYPDGTSETWSYDARGNEISHTDQAGHTSETEYGPFNLITGRTDAVGARYEFAYDNQLRLTKVTNPQNLSWTYVYGATGKLASETDFNGRTLTYDHNAAGLLIRRVNGAGEGVDLIRDTLGRVIELQVGDGQRATFGYDPAGRLTSAENSDARLVFTRDALGRVLTESVNGRNVSSTFDAAGHRLTRTTPDGRQSVWKYDLAGRPLTLASDTEELFFGHDAAGRETYRWIGRQTAISNEWDELGRLTARRVLGVDPENAGGSRLIHERAWAYRADGVPESITDSSEGPRQLALDPAGRVTTISAATWSEQYAYDLAGNVSFTADTRTPDAASTGPREVTGTLLHRAGRTHYEYDGQGRLIRRVQRTLSGNQKAWTYTYDARDRLTEATNPSGERWRYRYDPLGRRIVKQCLDGDGTVSEETRFAWDGTTVAEQVHGRGAGVEVVTTWDYEPDSWKPVTQVRRSYPAHAPQELVDRQFHAIVTDLVGAPTELLTVDGAVAWHRSASLSGETLPEALPEKEAATCLLRFPGQYHDAEIGLDYNYQRYYEPQTGRYTTPDPLGLAPAPNHHGYVDNQMLHLDPLGLAGGPPPGGWPTGPISMDTAVDLGANFVNPDARFVQSGSGGFQFISSEIDASGAKVAKIARIDDNPASPHVQQWGPHLNLETQVNGKTVTGGPLKDPHIPVDPATVRPGDLPCPP